MGYNCRCKKCGTDFVDTYGEFVNITNELECPVCGSVDLWVNGKIPSYKPFKPLYIGVDFDKLREEYERLER